MVTQSPAPPSGGGSSQSGMAFMIAAVLLVPISDAMSKSLTGILNPFEIAFWRFGFQMLVKRPAGGAMSRWRSDWWGPSS